MNLFAGLKTQNKQSLGSVAFVGPTRSWKRVNADRAAGRVAHIESETQSSDQYVDVRAARNRPRYDLTRMIVAPPSLHAPELSRKLKLK
jgi:hypothetical protein